MLLLVNFFSLPLLGVVLVEPKELLLSLLVNLVLLPQMQKKQL
jgi:hypothetical protein